MEFEQRMNDRMTYLFKALRQIRRCWLVAGALCLACLLFWQGSGLYAAPLNQTVPPPTPPQATQPAPTATSRPGNNNNDNNDNSDKNDEPTATPTPASTPTPEPLTAVVNVARLNVRQGPGTEFTVIGTVVSGEILRVISRNPNGDWWYICCVSNSTAQGWVSAQFVTANFDLGQANTLIPVADTLPEPPPPTATPTVATEVVELPSLQLQIRQMPPYSWQGQPLTLEYLVANDSEVVAQDVEFRNELPQELQLIGPGEIGSGVFMTETTPVGQPAFSITWPELAPGASITASVEVQIAADLADGLVFDNLAVVDATDFAPVTAGISIGMPPTALPDFQ
ncbi:MAG: SH3 domain-containing protein [Caldilineaceae bacterium]